MTVMYIWPMTEGATSLLNAALGSQLLEIGSTW